MLKEELRDTTLPPFKSAADHYNSMGFKAKTTTGYDKDFQSNCKTKLRGNYVSVVSTVLENMESRFDAVQKLVDEAFAKDVTAGGMTYFRANVLQYVETLSFTMRYSRKLLLWTLGEDNREFNKGSRTVPSLVKAEIDWLMANRQAFYHCVEVQSVPMVEVEKKLRAVPDVAIVPGEIEVVEQTVGAHKLDPLHMGLISAKLNPIYYIRMAVSEWQVNRYKAAQEEKRALEYRLLALREAAEGKRDAKLEQMIEYTEGRLQKLNRKLAEMEEGLDE